MSDGAKDKWAEVLDYLQSSKRDPKKVLNLLKGNQRGKESEYDVYRSSYSLNIIGVITQLQLDPKNKKFTLTQKIRNWVTSKDFESFYNLMRHSEKITYDRSKVEEYTKQLKDLWYSKSQDQNKKYFKKTKGKILMKNAGNKSISNKLFTIE